MAISPEVIGLIVETGIKLYEFIDKLSKGERGDSLQPIVDQLHRIRHDINKMGESLRLALGQGVEQIIGDIRLTQLAQLPDAHAAIRDYLRTHTVPPQPPKRDDLNYVTARGKSSDVLTYFINHRELAFLGGFIYAMNTRIAFIVSLDLCWFRNDPQYIGEIRNGINHLMDYIARVKGSIDAGFKTQTKVNFEFDSSVKPPIRVPVSHTITVLDQGTTIWKRTVDLVEQVSGPALDGIDWSADALVARPG